MPSRIDGGGPVSGGAYLSPAERNRLVATEEQLRRAKEIARKLPSADKTVVENAGQVAVNVSGPNNANHVFVPKAGSIADVDAVMGQLAATSLITPQEKERYNNAASEEEKRAIATEYITRAQTDLEQSLQALAPEELSKIESQYHVRTFADGQWGNASQAALTVLMTKGTELRDSERVPAPTDGMDDPPPPAVPSDDRPAGEGTVTDADKYFVSKNNGSQGMVMIEPSKLAELRALRARVEGGTASAADQQLWSDVQAKAKSLYVARFDEKTKPTAETTPATPTTVPATADAGTAPQDLSASLQGIDFDHVNWNTVASAGGVTPAGSEKHLRREDLEKALNDGSLTGDEHKVVEALLGCDALWKSWPGRSDDKKAVVISLDDVNGIRKQKGDKFQVWDTRSGFTDEQLAEADKQRETLRTLVQNPTVFSDLFATTNGGNNSTFEIDRIEGALAHATGQDYIAALEFFSDPKNFELIGGSDGKVSKNDLGKSLLSL